LAESLEGWAAQHRRPRSRQQPDRTRGVVLALALLLFTAMLGLSAVFLNRAAADTPGGLEGTQNANLISGCHLLFPDDAVKIEECINNAP
jgi:hypothetical protein